MATKENESLKEIKKKMLALKNAIEDYVDGIDMDEADGKKIKEVKKEAEEEDDG